MKARGAKAGRSSGVDVASRVLAAALGGYGLAAAVAVVMAVHLPLAAMEAVIVGTMLSFLVCAGAVIWAFAARRVLHAWIGLLAPAALLWLLAFAPGWVG